MAKVLLRSHLISSSQLAFLLQLCYSGHQIMVRGPQASTIDKSLSALGEKDRISEQKSQSQRLQEWAKTNPEDSVHAMRFIDMAMARQLL